MSLEVDCTTSERHTPVWIDLQLLQLLDLIQLETRGSASDVACVAALRALHRATHQGVQPSTAGGAALADVSDRQLKGYIASALREWRRLQLTVAQAVKTAEQRGTGVARGCGLHACSICSCSELTPWAKVNWRATGASADGDVTERQQAGGPRPDAANTAVEQPPQVHYVAKVCTSGVSLSVLAASGHAHQGRLCVSRAAVAAPCSSTLTAPNADGT